MYEHSGFQIFECLCGSRQILNAMLLANETIDLMLKSNNLRLLSKLDIAKAFFHG